MQTDPEAAANLHLQYQRRDVPFVIGGGAVVAATGGCERGVANRDRGFFICEAQPGQGSRVGRQADPPFLREVEAPVPR